MIDDSNEKDTLSGSHTSPTPIVSAFSQGQSLTPPASPAPRPMAQPKANVRLASSQKELALPKGTCNIGMSSVELPDEAQQVAGFYVDDPGLLVGQFRQYKFIQEKGQANDQSISL